MLCFKMRRLLLRQVCRGIRSVYGECVDNRQECVGVGAKSFVGYLNILLRSVTIYLQPSIRSITYRPPGSFLCTTFLMPRPHPWLPFSPMRLISTSHSRLSLLISAILPFGLLACSNGVLSAILIICGLVTGVRGCMRVFGVRLPVIVDVAARWRCE